MGHIIYANNVMSINLVMLFIQATLSI